ncbi:MAG: putative toxin-antitoxin system toxin component, PIN family [Anaerolineae bacterium]
MNLETRVFLDTSVLLAAVWSESGGSRLVLKLGEAGAVTPWVGPTVLREAEAVLQRKLAESRPNMALLLDRAHVQVGPKASEEALARALSAVDYLPDAQVLAEALGTGAEYFASLDPKHLVGNPRTETLPIVLGTPGDFLDWYRQRLGQIE